MQTVILIGDSIRIGYQETVRQELEGEAAIWTPEQNGGNSRRVLENVDAWAISHDPAVVHINCGLHDLRKEFDTGEPAVPISEYRENVTAILRALRERSNAQIIWAATTPVNQAWHHERKGFDRFEADVDAYNKEAGAACKELEVPINDLFKVIMDTGRDHLLLPDGVHFSKEGYELLGAAAAREIRAYL